MHETDSQEITDKKWTYIDKARYPLNTVEDVAWFCFPSMMNITTSFQVSESIFFLYLQERIILRNKRPRNKKYNLATKNTKEPWN